jgi:hypothetical protein
VECEGSLRQVGWEIRVSFEFLFELKICWENFIEFEYFVTKIRNFKKL